MSLIHAALEKLDQGKKSGWDRPAPLLAPKNEAGSLKENASGTHAAVLYTLGGALVFCFLAGLVYFATRPEAGRPLQGRKSSSHPLVSRGGPFLLTGITQIGSDRTAIVNNQLVRKGDQVDGALVESIDDGGVVLEREGRRVQLSLYGDSIAHLTRLETPSLEGPSQ